MQKSDADHPELHLEQYLRSLVDQSLPNQSLADQKKWPRILKLSVEGSQDDTIDNANIARIQLSVPEGLVWFDGHFPDQPVLPGIVQVHWAHAMASHVFQASLDPLNLTRLKFKAPILPGLEVELHLNINREKGSVKFAFRTETTEHSSGTMTVRMASTQLRQKLVPS